jgi:hypothetical protein
LLVHGLQTPETAATQRCLSHLRRPLSLKLR